MLKTTWNDTWLEYLQKLLSGSDMAYNTTVFFLFLIFFLGIYFLMIGRRMKRNWILFGNLCFYLWSGWGALWIVMGTAVIVYVTSRCMEMVYTKFQMETQNMTPKQQTKCLGKYKKRTRRYFLAALFFIAGIWIFVKTGKFLGVETAKTFSEVFQKKGIIVPLGISYYSLSCIGYLLEVYWRRVQPEHNFLNFVTVVTYFPHIVQGPVGKYEILLKQLKNLPGFEYQRVCRGFQLMIWGYIQKMVIADRLVIYTQAVFADPGKFAGIEILLAILLSAIQLYADFKGCMDIVGGISQTIGIELEKNFRQPFAAKSAQEFWSRWHITLGAWTKDYLYLPIALNPKFMRWTSRMKKRGRKKKASFFQAFIPLLAVWIFTGIWHGTGVDYIVWGMYWCLLMTLAKELQPVSERLKKALKIDSNKGAYRLFQDLRTYLLFAIGRTFTVTGSLAGCAVLWQQLFAQHRLWTLFDGSLYTYGLDQKDFYVAFAGIAVMIIVDVLHERGIRIRESIEKQKLPVRWMIYYGAIFALMVFGMYGPAYDAASFVYGAF